MKNKINELIKDLMEVEEKNTGKEKMEVYKKIEEKIEILVKNKLNMIELQKLG